MQTVQELLESYKAGTLERIKVFKTVCNDELKNPAWQPGSPDGNGRRTYPNGSPMTFCNMFVYTVLLRLGYNMDNYFTINPYTSRPDKYWTAINTFYDACVKYGNEVTPLQAQNFAKYGVPIVVIQRAQGADVGHIGFVYPDDKIQADKNDIAIVNAGSKDVMGVHSAYDCFYKWGYDPHYFHIS